MVAPGRILLIVGVAAGAFLAGSWYSRKPGSPAPAPGARRILYYHDPMHPAYKSDKPGIAPDCGMQLEPVYADGGASSAPAASGAAPAGSVRIGADEQQLIGLRVEEATKGSGTYTVRTPGRVALDERRVFRVAAAVDGWVRKAGPVATGDIVPKDEVLATFYNRDFLTAQQTYLYALNTMDRFQDNESAEQLKLTKAQMRAAEENLEFLGMGETQLREVARTRQVTRDIELRSPVAGLVLARNAFPGLRFDRGTELFRIADLNHVWILADVFENDARLIANAKSAEVVHQGRRLPVRMSSALPQFDPASRALRVRLELENPGFVLRPDTFVDVEFRVALPAQVVVPVDAVLDSGLGKTVFVDRGNGLFEPRRVETGWRSDSRIAITKGLQPGERIVVEGNFLVDSETRMKAAAAGAAGKEAGATAQDPVCGMDAGRARAPKSEYRGQTYYFCSDHCKRAFDQNPGHYLQTQTANGGARHD